MGITLALAIWVTSSTDVVVYELEVDGFSDRQRELAEFSIIEEANKREGLSAISIEEARVRSGYREEQGCQPKDCLAKLMDSIGSDLVVTGRITRIGDTTAVALRVIDLRQRSVVGSSTRQLVKSSGEGVLAALGPMVDELFDIYPVRDGSSSGVTIDMQERWEPEPLSPGFFYGGIAVTAATALAGIGFGIVAVQKRDDFEAAVTSTTPDNPANGAEIVELENDFRSARDASNLFYALSAASAIATTTLYFFTDFGNDSAFALTPTGDGVAASALVRF